MKILFATVIAGIPMLALAQPTLNPDRSRALRPRTTAQPVQPRPSGPSQAGAPSVALSSVTVEGTSLPAATVEAAWRPFVGQPLTGETIRAVTDAVSAAYGQSDIGLYTVVAPGQTFRNGELRLAAIEGRIAEAIIHGEDVEGRDMSLLKAYAGKLTSEPTLTRRSLERYVSLIRDIPGLRPQIELLAGSEPGAVKLGIGAEQTRNEFGLYYSSRNPPLLGRNQVQGDWSINSLLRQGDQTTLTVATSTDFDRMRYGAISHSQPIGSEGLRGEVFISHLRTRPDSIPVRGSATAGGVSFSYPVLRSYSRNFYITGSLDGLNSKNAVFGTQFAQERTRVLRVGASYGADKPNTGYSIAAKGSFGLDSLGARVDPLVADAEFQKLVVDTAFDRRLGRNVTVRLRGSHQFSGDALPVSEQFALGGETYGRAYAYSQVLADKGHAASAELAFTPNVAPTNKLAGTELYVFGDAGDVRRNARPIAPASRESLSSAGVGVRFRVAQAFTLGVEGAKGLDLPSGVTKDNWRGAVSLRGSF